MKKTYRLRYSGIWGLQTIVGLLLLLPILFWRQLLEFILTTVFLLYRQFIAPVPPAEVVKSLAQIPSFVYVIIAIICICLVFFTIRAIYNAIFLKTVTIEELDERQFTLSIGQKQIVYQKSDICDLAFIVYKNRWRTFNDAELLIKMTDRSYKFLQEIGSNQLKELYEILSNWRTI